MERLEQQLDKLSETMQANQAALVQQLSGIHSTQAVQTEQLKEHMRRTELLEEAMDALEVQEATTAEKVATHSRVLGFMWKVVGPILTALVLAKWKLM